MSEPAANISPRLVPFSAALLYIASLSVFLAQEWHEPQLLVVAFFGPSLLAGLLIQRFAALLLPLAVIVLSWPWVPTVDEEPFFAMMGGLLAGVVLARVLDRRPAETDARARAQGWPTTKRLARQVVSRQGVDNVLDHIRFRIDTFPHGVYQPVASLPVARATRGTGSESRWEAILPVVREQGVESAVDIGACEGYFSIMLGEAGIPTIALEGDRGNARNAMLAIRRSGLEDVGVLVLALNPGERRSRSNLGLTICLSIWHHFVRYYGLDDATRDARDDLEPHAARCCSSTPARTR